MPENPNKSALIEEPIRRKEHKSNFDFDRHSYRNIFWWQIYYSSRQFKKEIWGDKNKKSQKHIVKSYFVKLVSILTQKHY